VAEAVAQNPLKRSVMFVLFTAEEIGHFGSLHFVAHPPVPHEQIILNINLEQVGAKSRMIDGVGVYGLICLLIVVGLILRDPVWKKGRKMGGGI